MKEKILVVDDEKDILELIDYNLTKNGYRVKTVTTGEDALELIKENDYDLIILDLMLPGVDGFDICKIIKADKQKASIPIVMVTAKSDEADKVAGLEIGADHYVTKPFSPRELLAIVKATLRRKPLKQEEELTVIERGDLKIHIGRHEVTIKGNKIELTHLEFKILVTLAKKPGWVMTRYQIVDATRGEGVPVTDRSIDVHVVSLRKKLGAEFDYIITIRGVGYKFKEKY
ncbi:MAG TPA: response regulator transcription factor [Ignavibacteria bacterium]|nr:response regulator transcription factor [Ignavibacteria bacterium]